MSSKVIYFLVKSVDACFTYRIAYPMKYLQRNYGWEVFFDQIDTVFETNDDGTINAKRIKKNRLEVLEQASIVVIQRGTDEAHLNLLRFVRDQLKKPVIYEADDNYVDVPHWNSGHRHFFPRKHIIEQIISEADAMSVSVQNLSMVYGKYNGDITVLKNCIDFERIDEAENVPIDQKIVSLELYRNPVLKPEEEYIKALEQHAARMLVQQKREPSRAAIDKMLNTSIYYNLKIPFDKYAELAVDESKVIIGWGGSPTHVLDIELVKKPLVTVMHKYRYAHLAMIGFTYMMHVLRGSTHAAHLNKWVREIDINRFWSIGLVGVRHFYKLLKIASFDIGLAPVSPVTFNKGKSNLKVIEYMALGAYPIASDFDTYRGVMYSENAIVSDVAAGKGRLCKTALDWERALYDVLNNEDMRKETVAFNKKFVREHYNIETYAEKWDSFYSRFL